MVRDHHLPSLSKLLVKIRLSHTTLHLHTLQELSLSLGLQLLPLPLSLLLPQLLPQCNPLCSP